MTTAGAGEAPSEAPLAEAPARRAAALARRLLKRPSVILGAITFFSGFGMMSGFVVLPALTLSWGLTSIQAHLIVGAGLAGQFAGAILFGWMADRHGRALALARAGTLFAVTSYLCIFAWDYVALLVLSLIAGLGIGGAASVAAVYLAEIADAQRRGHVVMLSLFALPAGFAAASFGGAWIVPRLSWQYMFALAAIPAILSLFLRRLLPESPRWLARQADLSTNGPPSAGAERAQPASERMLARMRARLALLGSHPLWLDFFGPGARRRTLCLWTVSFAAFFLAYGMIVWLPDWGRGFSAPTLLATIHLAGLAGALAAAVIIDRTGRRPLLAACFAGAALSLGALWLQWPGPAEWLPLFSSLGCFFAGGTVTGALLYSAELYPTRIRALGAGVAAAWTRIAWLAGLFITGAAIPGEPALLLPILAAIAALAAALTALFAVETSGRALEDISP